VAVATSPAPATAAVDAPDWEQPSSAALTWVLVGAGLLALGALVGTLTAVQTFVEDFFTLSAATSYGRLRPVATTLLTFGVGMAATGVALDLVRRIVRAPVGLPVLARAGGALTTLGVLGGALAVLLGHSTGRPGLELPRPFAGAVAVGLLLAAGSALRTLAGRREDALHPAAWFLASGLVAGPAVLLLGALPQPRGINDEIVRVFGVSGLQLLWLTSLAVGILFYVVPTAGRGPFVSRSLAAVALWGWLVLAPLAGAARLVAGPAQEWLEAIGAAAAIGLLVPALAVVAAVLSTYSRRTALTHSPELRLALAAALLLALAVTVGALHALRPVADLVHLTVAGELLDELLVVGAAGAATAAGALHVVPALSGNRLANPRLSGAIVWLVAGGATLVFLGLAAAGYVQGTMMRTAVVTGEPFGTSDWSAVADAVRPLLTIRLLGELLLAAGWVGLFQQLFSTTAFGDPLASDEPGATAAAGVARA
jgi:cytochrome c oxidase cbb3-type subunit I